MSIEILEPGLLTLVVDKGRYGYRRFGIPPSGAMDYFAYHRANMCTRNRFDEAALEINIIGPRMRFLQGSVIAITGAECSPRLDGEPIPLWKSVWVPQDGILSFGPITQGCRAYISIRGGIDVPQVLGSRSTLLSAGIGGFEGRALRIGDVIPIDSHPLSQFELSDIRITPSVIPRYISTHTARIILGPQDDHFTDEGIQAFLDSSYTVTTRSDRAGYRLEGSAVETKAGSDIISEGTTTGAIQITGDGKPLIIMRDGPTVGGYAKIGTIISEDIDGLGQAKPGDTIRFKSISLDSIQ